MDPNDHELDRIASCVQEEAINDTRRRGLFFDPKTTYISVSAAAVILFFALRYAMSYGETERRLEKLERQSWTKFHQRLWEQEMRQMNPALHVPKTSDIDTEVDPLK